MREDIRQARECEEETARLHQADKTLLDGLVGRCQHDWSDPAYTPVIQEAYFNPGDPPGTMGVDRQLPCHVPRSEIPKWTQTCRICGSTRTTIRTKDEVKKIPQF